MLVCVHTRACLSMCVRVWVCTRACVHVCTHVDGCMHAVVCLWTLEDNPMSHGDSSLLLSLCVFWALNLAQHTLT